MHIFVSDAHIRSDRSRSAQKLMQFLNEKKPHMTHLYIVGDLFEFWFEYKYVLPKRYFKTLATLFNLAESGKTIHYILGNHEIMVGNLLKDYGLTVHRQPVTFTIHGRRVYVSHGHKIDKRLWSTLWERLLASKFNRSLYQLLHPDIGVVLAQSVAALSRKQPFSTDVSVVFEKYARSQLHDHDIVILAHSHIPAFSRFDGNKYYINLGDWIEHFTYAVIDKDTVALKHYTT